MMRRLFFWALLAGLIGFWAFGDRLFPPKIIRAEHATISDGDTLTIDKVVFRLHGIDAPEYHQICKDENGLDWECGKVSRLHLADLARSGSITCAPRAEDKYGRKVAKCSSATVPDLAAAMVEAGLAISPAERGSAAYEEAQATAKTGKKGIWRGSFIAPSDWRTAHPRGNVVQTSMESMP